VQRVCRPRGVGKMLRLACVLFAVLAVTHGNRRTPTPCASTYVNGTDRPGGDYSNFALEQADPNLCWQFCCAAPECRAWVYCVPGVEGPQPWCWLKNTVPPTNPLYTVISGVILHNDTVFPQLPSTFEWSLGVQDVSAPSFAATMHCAYEYSLSSFVCYSDFANGTLDIHLWRYDLKQFYWVQESFLPNGTAVVQCEKSP